MVAFVIVPIENGIHSIKVAGCNIFVLIPIKEEMLSKLDHLKGPVPNKLG